MSKDHKTPRKAVSSEKAVGLTKPDRAGPKMLRTPLGFAEPARKRKPSPQASRHPLVKKEEEKVLVTLRQESLPLFDAPSSAAQEEEMPTPPVEVTFISSERKETTTKEKNTMAHIINHKPIDGKRNIERQAREQRTINQVLSGITLTIILGIVFVGALASTGGYILWRQIQDQSTTIADLESRTKMRIAEMELDLNAKDIELEKAHANVSKRVTEINTAFEVYCAEANKKISELHSANKKLERRLAAYAKKVEDQSDLISYYQSKRGVLFR